MTLIVFEFRVYGDDGELLGESSEGKPRVFEVGSREILPALEEQLVQMAAGEERSIVLGPDQAYGHIQTDAFEEFPIDSIPEQARQVGRKVSGRAPDGSEETFDVVEIRGDVVVLDMNHPMAGRTLRFDVKVLGVEPSSAAEGPSGATRHP